MAAAQAAGHVAVGRPAAVAFASSTPATTRSVGTMVVVQAAGNVAAGKLAMSVSASTTTAMAWNAATTAVAASVFLAVVGRNHALTASVFALRPAI